MPDRPLTVRDNRGAHRYEAILDGALAGIIMYEVTGPHVLALTHTVVEQAHRGQGIATALVKATLDDMRAKGVQVIPICPVVDDYITRHPEYADLVASGPTV